ncbi:polyphosphate kinase 1 [Crocosphaera sp. XPORK-15E]|uniref:polyphosphate kinase 1 n=1 Tax=Crocosphaera sp. XPORK-15E TaxID=3110247 RepID=UPI002B1EC0BD|nr:polyphosphate kinase 1 [Crocosphaera sp. XPORK-15E]MEA5536640.1 polyphosphate kinase 1 [Crocosphaera sp. XPORK-15E]
MPKTEKESGSLNLKDQKYYLNREISWLEFNKRVLHESEDHRTPLLERLKFSAIFSSNLDEFFMIRVSTLKEQVEAQVSQLTPDGLTPQEQLEAIEKKLRPSITKQHQQFEQELRPQLTRVGVHLLNYTDLEAQQIQYLQDYFKQQIFPVLTPLAVDPGHPFPTMANLSLNLAVTVENPSTQKENFARVKVPIDLLPRFIPLPSDFWQGDLGTGVWVGVPLEQVIADNLSFLFPGMKIKDTCLFRLTRDADFPVQEDEADDLLIAIQQEISKRHFQGFTVRLEIEQSASSFIKEMLMKGLQISSQEVYEIPGLLNLKDLMFFLSMPLPELKDPLWTAVIPPRLKPVNNYPTSQEEDYPQLAQKKDVFGVIRQGDLLVHHPYESFADSVELFITQAADDPQVLAIKMTLYRTSGDSPIIKALIKAAQNQKQVAALVELKARFDEESNINWARELEAAGVHVVYGLVGLKTHTKTVLVVRKEDQVLRRYVHIGTGNYNSKTAKLYTDVGVFSCREELGEDLTDLFNYLTGFSQQQSYRKLLVAPFSLRPRLISLIQREIEQAKQGKSAQIIAKMNSLVDPQLIQALYEASRAGVEIKLIIRGICCLRPGIEGVSENIQVISIIGRYLEHSRIFYFHNDTQSEIFIGSADWMPRNLDRRVEVVTPVDDPDLAKNLRDMLDIFWSDNRQAWELQSDGSYRQRYPENDEPERNAQQIFMEKAAQLDY